VGLELSIEQGRVTDAKALSAIAQSTFELACPAESNKSEIAKYIAENLGEPQFKQMLLSDETPVFCARANSSIVGFLILGLSSPCPANPTLAHTTELKRLYVSPDFHGTGAADLLIRAAFDICHKHHRAGIWLSVFSGNLRAIRFYARSGFAKVGSTYFEMGNEMHLDDVMLATRLTTQK